MHNGNDKMIIGAPKEIAANEKRVAMTPDSATQLQNLVMTVLFSQVLAYMPVFPMQLMKKLASKSPKPLKNCGKPPILLARFARQRQMKSNS